MGIAAVPEQFRIDVCHGGNAEIWITQGDDAVIIRLENMPLLIAALQEQYDKWKAENP